MVDEQRSFPGCLLPLIASLMQCASATGRPGRPAAAFRRCAPATSPTDSATRHGAVVRLLRWPPPAAAQSPASVPMPSRRHASANWVLGIIGDQTTVIDFGGFPLKHQIQIHSSHFLESVPYSTP